MRIRAERDDLADVLARAARALSARSPLPILQGLHLEVRGKRLVVTGTDNEMTVRTFLEVEALEEGTAVVPGRLLSDAVRKLTAGAVIVGTEDGQVEVSGVRARFDLRALDVAEFPQVSEDIGGETIEVDADRLLVALQQVGVAASTDEARPTLTGVLFEGEEGQLRLVATDSYRLAVRDLPGIAAVERTRLVPHRGLRELGRTIAESGGKVTVALGDREASFVSDRGRLTVRVIDATFPNYRQLLPDSYPNRLVVPKDAILEAVGRAALIAEDHIPVRLGLQKGGVELSVIRQEVGREAEFVEGTYEGEEMTIAFNTRYLTDGISVVEDDQVVLETLDPLKPGLLRGAERIDFRYLLMPVRL